MKSPDHSSLVAARRYLRDGPHNRTKYTYEYTTYGEPNHTVTTSVSIRVTPVDDHLVSWAILWAGFVIAALIAAWQIVRENRVFAARRSAAVLGDGDQSRGVVGDGESVSTADVTRSMVRVYDGRCTTCRTGNFSGF